MELISNASVAAQMMEQVEDPGLLELAFGTLRDMWTEALVIAIALHVYFRAARGGAGFLARHFGGGGGGGKAAAGGLQGKMESVHHALTSISLCGAGAGGGGAAGGGGRGGPRGGRGGGRLRARRPQRGGAAARGGAVAQEPCRRTKLARPL